MKIMKQIILAGTMAALLTFGTSTLMKKSNQARTQITLPSVSVIASRIQIESLPLAPKAPAPKPTPEPKQVALPTNFMDKMLDTVAPMMEDLQALPSGLPAEPAHRSKTMIIPAFPQPTPVKLVPTSRPSSRPVQQ